MPGWNKAAHDNQLPPGWDTTRRYVLDRDHHTCQWRETNGTPCGAPAHEVDHITPRWRGGTHDPANLRALCPWHHRQATVTDRPKRTYHSTRHPGEKHPGLTA